LAGRGFIHDDGAASVELQGGCGDHARYRTFDGFGDDFRLALARSKPEAAAAFEDRADAHGDRAPRHTIFTSKEWRVLFERRRSQSFDACARAERGERFVKADMARFADPEQLHVNAAEALNQSLILAAFGIEVFGETVGKMRVARVHVHVPKQMVIHVMAVGIGIGWKQTDVFVEVEGAAKGKIELLLLMKAHKIAIDTFHRFARSQAEHEVRIGTQLMGDDPRNERGGRFRVRLYDDFHGAYLTSSVKRVKWLNGFEKSKRISDSEIQ